MEVAVVATWKRRDTGLTTAALLVAVLAAAMALVLLTRSHKDLGAALPIRPAQTNPPRVHGHLSFGMTPQQVLRRTGRPVKTHGNCWLFAPTKAGIVGSVSVQPSWSRLPYDPKTRGALELCFTGGRYSYAYQHMFDPHKQKWIWFAWPQTLMHGSSPDYADNF